MLGCWVMWGGEEVRSVHSSCLLSSVPAGCDFLLLLFSCMRLRRFLILGGVGGGSCWRWIWVYSPAALPSPSLSHRVHSSLSLCKSAIMICLCLMLLSVVLHFFGYLSVTWYFLEDLGARNEQKQVRGLAYYVLCYISCIAFSILQLKFSRIEWHMTVYLLTCWLCFKASFSS